MGGGAAQGIGDLTDYIASLGTSGADVGMSGLEAGLLDTNPWTLLPSLIFQGLEMAGVIPDPMSLLMEQFQGLPANAKPDMFAKYLEQQGGKGSQEGLLGRIIQAAQNKAGTGSGILSQSGPGAFNINFVNSALEALTGQNTGTVDPRTGKITFNAPATGGVQHGVSESFNPASTILQELGLGAGGYGFTPAQLSTPQAQAAILKAIHYGDIGSSGAGKGVQNLQKYLPQIIANLKAAGITPGGDTGGGGNKPPQDGGSPGFDPRLPGPWNQWGDQPTPKDGGDKKTDKHCTCQDLPNNGAECCGPNVPGGGGRGGGGGGGGGWYPFPMPYGYGIPGRPGSPGEPGSPGSPGLPGFSPTPFGAYENASIGQGPPPFNPSNILGSIIAGIGRG